MAIHGERKASRGTSAQIVQHRHQNREVAASSVYMTGPDETVWRFRQNHGRCAIAPINCHLRCREAPGSVKLTKLPRSSVEPAMMVCGPGTFMIGVALTVSVKSSKAVLLPSFAVTRTIKAPTSAVPGVPENVRVVGLNESHEGSTPPVLASVTEYTSGSRFGSLNVLAANVKLNRVRSVAVWLGIGLTTIGGGLITLRMKSSKTVLLPSLAVTRTIISRTSAVPGVPENVRVVGSNESHEGSTPPVLASVTEYTSGSRFGITERIGREREVEQSPLGGRLVGDRVDNDRRRIDHAEDEVVKDGVVAVVGGDAHDNIADIRVPGVPENVRVVGLNESHEGSTPPVLASVTEYTSGSRFGSLNVLAANVKLNRVRSVAVWLGIALTTIGGGLITLRMKSSKTVLLPSLAVTRTIISRTSAVPGVPENVRVVGLNESHEGSTPPVLASVTEYTSGSRFGSLNVLAANVKLNRSPSVAVWLGIGLTTIGGGLITLRMKSSKTVLLPSSAVTRTVNEPTLAVPGVPENLRVVGLNVSHEGSAPPLPTSVAE